MPLDGRVRTLNRVFKEKSAQDVLADGLSQLGRTAMVSSFGADSVVLLHMVAQIDRATPVLFIDTDMLFAETLEYQRDVATMLGLSNVQIIRADRATVFERDNENLLHLHDPDACCALRKTAPLQAALQQYDGWISGRRRDQGAERAQLDLFELERPLGRLPRVKVNPLTYWDAQDMADYLNTHTLPRHPLVAKGYPSLGCAPCTSPAGHNEPARAGRWRHRAKTECGIHFAGARA